MTNGTGTSTPHCNFNNPENIHHDLIEYWGLWPRCPFGVVRVSGRDSARLCPFSGACCRPPCDGISESLQQGICTDHFPPETTFPRPLAGFAPLLHLRPGSDTTPLREAVPLTTSSQTASPCFPPRLLPPPPPAASSSPSSWHHLGACVLHLQLRAPGPPDLLTGA